VNVQDIHKIESYLRQLFDNAGIRVVPRPAKTDVAEVYLADDKLGELTVDDEDEEDYNFRMEFRASASAELPELNNYLNQKFGNNRIRVVRRERKKDSLEAYLGDEFIGVLFIEEGKAHRSFILEVPILGIDLQP
jgi:hypothetical protein